MTSPVVRGGRFAATTKAEQSAQEEAALAEVERHLSDIRTLLHHPEFVRYVKHHIAQSRVFLSLSGLPHDQLREALGRGDMGRAMWNEIVAADPRRVLDLIDLTHSKEDSNA